MIKGIVIGAAGLLCCAVVASGLIISLGFFPANADSRPSRLEAWLAHEALHAVINRQASRAANPLAPTDENVIAGIKIYASNCAVCHGVSDGKPSRVARGLYQKPPQFAKSDTFSDPEYVDYWKIEHGIRMTGMPAFKSTLSSDEIWKLCLFLKRGDSLSPGADRVWKSLRD